MFHGWRWLDLCSTSRQCIHVNEGCRKNAGHENSLKWITGHPDAWPNTRLIAFDQKLFGGQAWKHWKPKFQPLGAKTVLWISFGDRTRDHAANRSSDPESHPKVGFESVPGFGFRVSGFGFRRLKPTFAVGFGFRVSSIETHFRCRFRISGFGFRPLKPTFAVGFGFRVSGFVAWNQLSLSVSGFGFRVSGFVAWNQLSLSVSGFGFRVSGFVAWNALSLSVSGFGFRVSSIEANFSCPFRVSGFGFRRSKPPLDSPVRCRSHITQVSFSMQSSKTRAVSDKRLKRSERKNGNGLGETCQHP